MRKIQYNSFDVLLKQLAYFFTSLFIILLGSTYLLANEINYKEVFSKGRAVIVENNVSLAKKRALEDALYLASLQGGAKVDGYSSVDMNTNLNENVLIRPSSTIKDFVIIEESQDETHYNVTIKAYLVTVNSMLNCANRDFVNLPIEKAFTTNEYNRYLKTNQSAIVLGNNSVTYDRPLTIRDKITKRRSNRANRISNMASNLGFDNTSNLLRARGNRLNRRLENRYILAKRLIDSFKKERIIHISAKCSSGLHAVGIHMIDLLNFYFGIHIL